MEPATQFSMEARAVQMGFTPQRPRQMAVRGPSEWALSCLAAKLQVGPVLSMF